MPLIKHIKQIALFTALGLFAHSLFINQAQADSNHSPLLIIISSKIKLQKILTEIPDNTRYCAQYSNQVNALLNDALKMLVEYTKEGQGHYINQTAYAQSLEQRAKILETFADLMQRINKKNLTCLNTHN